MFQTKVVEKMKTRVLCSATFLKNYAIYEVMWKNMLETDRPEVTMENCACTLHAGNVRLQAYTQDINTYYLPTATMVTQMHINDMFVPTLPVLLHFFVLLAVSDCSVEDEGSGKETVGKTGETRGGACQGAQGITKEGSESYQSTE